LEIRFSYRLLFIVLKDGSPLRSDP